MDVLKHHNAENAGHARPQHIARRAEIDRWEAGFQRESARLEPLPLSRCPAQPRPAGSSMQPCKARGAARELCWGPAAPVAALEVFVRQDARTVGKDKIYETPTQAHATDDRQAAPFGSHS